MPVLKLIAKTIKLSPVPASLSIKFISNSSDKPPLRIIPHFKDHQVHILQVHYKMYFTRVLIAVGLLATSTLACNPGEWGCGNQNGVQGPDGAVYVCNSSGGWVLSAQCNGKTCCQINDAHTDAHCIC